MKIADYEAVNKIAERISESAGKDVEFEWYWIILRVGQHRFRLMDNGGGDGIQIRAVSEEIAKQEAIQILAMGGWSLVNNEGLILEVDRVYATRIDCPIEPEGVRQATIELAAFHNERIKGSG